jgi:hypothetical protein
MAKRSSQGLASLLEERPVEAFEQLNVAERVVPLHNWFFLAAAFLTLGAFGAFSFWWQVPLKLEGRGILLTKHIQGSESVLQVTAPATGRLGKVARHAFRLSPASGGGGLPASRGCTKFR